MYFMPEQAGKNVAADLKAGLWLGTAKIDITPSKPVPLAGFAHRLGKFTSVADRLYAKVWYFRYYNEQGTHCDALLVQGDLVYWGPDYIDSVIGEIAMQYGIAQEAILFHGTHTHSGPQTDGRLLPLSSVSDREYMEWMISQVLTGVTSASRNLEPVTIDKGYGLCSIGINRRGKVDGKMTMSPNPEGPTDPEVMVLQFKTTAEKSKGVMVHYTCHPTTTDSTMVSSEYCGVAAEKIADRLGSDTMVSFLQGCCGDIRPALIRNGQFYRGDHRDVERFANELSGIVMNILACPMETMVSSGVFALKKTFMLPVSRVPDIMELEKMQVESGSCLSEWRNMLLKNPKLLKPYIPLTMTLLQITNGLAFLGLGAEVVVHYGLYIKKMSDRKILPLGYTNGMVGYLPTREQLSEGGYEAWEAPYYFGLPAPFDTKVQACIEQGLLAMIHQFRA
jgi:hypothetical protein